jgi:hypothetical protein
MYYLVLAVLDYVTELHADLYLQASVVIYQLNPIVRLIWRPERAHHEILVAK